MSGRNMALSSRCELLIRQTWSGAAFACSTPAAPSILPPAFAALRYRHGYDPPR